MPLPKTALRLLRGIVRVLGALSTLALVTGVACRLASAWYWHRFGDVGFDSILFTLLFQKTGAERGQIESFVFEAAVPAVVLGIVAWVLFLGRSRVGIDLVRRASGRRLRIWPFPPAVRIALSSAAAACLLFASSKDVGLGRWLAARAKYSTFIEDRYVPPRSVGISFPDKRRNLICLYVESAETTFFSKEQGGAMDVCVVPELYGLARENVSFSHDGGIGGWPATPGTGFTAAAMVALTMGVPLKVPLRGNEYVGYERFLPGAVALGDILRDAGYRQALLVGSDPAFAARDKLYLQHGTDEIFDPETAVRDGIIPEGYHRWWGFEDSVLFRYARKILADLASSGKPFCLTLLTADTHAVGGFVCDRCERRFADPYENVFACTSRQVGDFIEWLKDQPYWNDTTVLVCGDHPSMDHPYFRRHLPEGGGFKRHVYNCILNAVPLAPPDRTRNRAFSPMDMFPTILAAMGCTIEGDRLGLGVNLFSDTPTLAEELGVATYHEKLRERSDFYLYKIVLGR